MPVKSLWAPAMELLPSYTKLVILNLESDNQQGGKAIVYSTVESVVVAAYREVFSCLRVIAQKGNNCTSV